MEIGLEARDSGSNTSVEAQISLLKEHFLRTGMEIMLGSEVKIPQKIRELFDLVLRDGNNRIGVRIYVPRFSLTSQIKRSLERKLVETARASSHLDKTYLAIPEVVDKISVVDSRIFRASGVGLLVVKQKRVEERIPASSYKRNRLFSPELDEKISEITARVQSLDEFRGETKEISTRLQYLIDRVDDIEEGLKKVRSRIRQLEVRVSSSSARARGVLYHPSEEVEIPGDEGLPTFIAGNPWVVELGKRGVGDETRKGE